ncbi:putative nucleoside-diphosphate-sugar epimerase family protein [Daldinia childiae]|uniref:putative nucleoside-diphosphate-sugar epimerase family protein n=1 Tax=Daldinia childiae TaxID=326645 RepID=UPI001446C96A|nr:putative nucleoside-diphosphate-sugar epimerase family protein [Daldinia childiae]KAF3071096.1 putative nucleoside-diphosphate-sugar epimerase family protein [Daldinia childiae]
MSIVSCTILVVGATGQQGGSVLAELSQQLSTTPEAKVKVFALTRTASSPKAQALPSKYPSLDLSVVEGDVQHPEPIFKAHSDIDTVFSYTTPPDEEPQATHLIDAACAHATPEKPTHFVFSSVDRGGEPKSWDTPTDVPHFAQKHNVELHLRTVAEGSDGRLTYTILRPVAFMDNLNPGGTFGMVFASLWSTMSASRKLQLVSVRDIGLFACKALLHRADPNFRNRAVGLAGDELTLEEVRSIYARVAGGASLPQAWTLVGWAVRGLVARNVGSMFRWFEAEGYGVDIDALRAEEPRVQNLEAWLRESSKFEFASEEGTDV